MPDTSFSALDLAMMPRVEIVYSYAGADGALVDAAVAAGARGIVSAGFAPGSPTPEQRRRFLPDLVRGSVTWCIGLSEPDVGSDLASVRTTARRDGDGWVLDGTKVWTSFGLAAEWCYLVARTNPDAPPHAGLSELVVDMSSPGITVRPIRDMTGADHFAELHLEEEAAIAGEVRSVSVRRPRRNLAIVNARVG